MAASGAAGDEPIRDVGAPAGAPAAAPAKEKWLNVILDIDETLVQFGEKADFDAIFPNADERKKYEFSGNWILRPGFDKFLKWLRDNCLSVSLWTLSEDTYARDVRDMIQKRIPELKLKLVLYDVHNEEATKYFGGRKSLKYIWNEKSWSKTFNKYNTVLIDDLSASTEGDNSPNGIWIPPFSPLGLSIKKDPKVGRKRKGPYVDFSEDHVFEDIIKILEKLTPRPFRERPVVEGIHRPDEDILHAGKHRKTRRGKKARKTKTRR